MTEELTSVGERIRRGYQAVGLNRNQFAKKLGTTYPNAMRWENNETTPKGDYLVKIAVIIGRTPRWILTGEDDEGSPEFAKWLDELAPDDLTGEEREALRTWALPGKHPGPTFYATALATWRALARVA